MPKEIFPSSFECDCGHQSHFCENTIREMEEMSAKGYKKCISATLKRKHTRLFFTMGK